jgi:hypothetical protein
MKAVRCAFLIVILAPMLGCQLLAGAAGVNEYVDKDGVTRVHVDTSSPLDTAERLTGLLGPWGIAAGTALLLAKKVIRHREILAHGQADDDFDGIPDDQQQPQSQVKA